MTKIKDYLNQEENSIFCLQPCVLTISMGSYELNDNMLIKEDENIIWVNSLISAIKFEDGNEFDIILDYPITLKYTEIIKTKENIIIKYNSDDEILDVPLQKEDIKEMVLYIERLLGGRERFKNINHLFLKLYKMYFDISDMDLVHLEVLLSQVLRDKNNPMIPARVGSDPEHPVLMNIKKDIFNSSFLGGLAFENIGEAIKSGLIATTELQPSVLEKVLTGTLVTPKEREH